MKKRVTKKYIYQAFENYYRTANCDRYGQLKTIDVYSLFPTSNWKGEKIDGALPTEYCLSYVIKKDLVSVNTYGSQYGTYKGISPWGSFKDIELEQICKDAFAKNLSRKNCNNW